MLFILTGFFTFTTAQVYLESWIENCDDEMGYYILSNGQSGYNLANVQAIYFTDEDVYIESTGIPEYDIGPFPDGNPSTPGEQDYRFLIYKSPQEEAGTHTSTPLGPIGVFINGVPLFNALDAHSWQNEDVWHQNAVVAEADGFDACLGHPAPDPGGNISNGMYHHHQNPVCLREQVGDDGSDHSPILAWAFDGYPIYGPFAFSEPSDSTSGIRRMESSYQLRDITVRHTLSDGTELPQNQWGPNVGGAYPLGYYVEDYEFLAGVGDLDEFNGQFCVTPQYPEGTYAYFVTIDSADASAYPYMIGPDYYGVVATENFMGPPPVNIPYDAQLFTGCLAVNPEDGLSQIPVNIQLHQNYPNPFNPTTTIRFSVETHGSDKIGMFLQIYDITGRLVETLINGRLVAGEYEVIWDASGHPSGVYLIQLTHSDRTHTRKTLLLK